MGPERKALIVLVAITALVLGALAGCGGGGLSTGSSTTTTTGDVGDGGATARGGDDVDAPHKGKHGGASKRSPANADDTTPRHHHQGIRQADDHGGSPAKSSAGDAQKPDDRGTSPANPKKSSKQATAPKPEKSPASGTKSQSGGQTGKEASRCSSRRCVQEQAIATEEAGGGQPSAVNQCPAAMTAAECEAAGRMIEEGGGTAETTVGCPAAMSEAECREVGEIYEAATK